MEKPAAFRGNVLLNSVLYSFRSASAGIFFFISFMNVAISLGQEAMSPQLRFHVGNKPAEAQFMKRYISLRPEEQVKIWRGTKSAHLQNQMESVLIVSGRESVPYLAEAIRGTSDKFSQVRTLKVLSDMDRFVPDVSLARISSISLLT